MNVIQKKNKVIFNGTNPTNVGYEAALKLNRKADHAWTGVAGNFVYRKHHGYFRLNRKLDIICEE